MVYNEKEYNKKYYSDNRQKENARSKKWKDGHKEQVKKQRKRYLLAHLEHLKNCHKKWIKDNRIACRRYCKNYYAKNKKRLQTMNRKWKLEHKDYMKKYMQNEDNYSKKLFLNSRRRALRKNAEGSHTLEEWELLKKQYGFTCPSCKKKEPEIRLTEDHIIPLVKGGSDYIENIQPLCKSCNCSKHTEVTKYANC